MPNYDATARAAGWTPNTDGKWVHRDKPTPKYDSARAVVDGEGLTPKPE